MRLRKFTARTYSEALALVKRELGENALIVSTRTLRKHLRDSGTPHEKAVEITAAIEYPVQKPEKTGGDPAPDSGGLAEMAENPDLKTLILSLLGETEKARCLGLKKEHMEFFLQLIQTGVEERLAAKTIEKGFKGKNGSLMDAERRWRHLKKFMERVLVCGGGIQLNGQAPRKVALVGPPGAGKTTTLAKIASDFALRQRKKVALISLDTYRIGALEQLRVYGDIMQIPVEMALDREGFINGIQAHSDRDIILIDTVGRGHKDSAHARELKDLFDSVGGVESHLVLSVTAQEPILNAAYRQFSPLNIDRLLFTKLDEGLSFGSLYNFSLRTRIPFSYFTLGQRVPEDIEVATGDKVIRLIFN